MKLLIEERRRGGDGDMYVVVHGTEILRRTRWGPLAYWHRLDEREEKWRAVDVNTAEGYEAAWERMVRPSNHDDAKLDAPGPWGEGPGPGTPGDPPGVSPAP